MMNDVEDETPEQYYGERDIERPHNCSQLFPICPKRVAAEGKRPTPDERAGEGVDDKGHNRGSRDSHWK